MVALTQVSRGAPDVGSDVANGYVRLVELHLPLASQLDDCVRCHHLCQRRNLSLDVLTLTVDEGLLVAVEDRPEA